MWANATPVLECLLDTIFHTKLKDCINEHTTSRNFSRWSFIDRGFCRSMSPPVNVSNDVHHLFIHAIRNDFNRWRRCSMNFIQLSSLDLFFKSFKQKCLITAQNYVSSFHENLRNPGNCVMDITENLALLSQKLAEIIQHHLLDLLKSTSWLYHASYKAAEVDLESREEFIWKQSVHLNTILKVSFQKSLDNGGKAGSKVRSIKEFTLNENRVNVGHDIWRYGQSGRNDLILSI